MRERMLQETANRKRHQFALEPERHQLRLGYRTRRTSVWIRTTWKNARRVGDRKTSERQYNCQPRWSLHAGLDWGDDNGRRSVWGFRELSRAGLRPPEFPPFQSRLLGETQRGKSIEASILACSASWRAASLDQGRRCTTSTQLSPPAIEDRTKRREGPSTSDRAIRHQLVANVREFFEAGRLSEVGYLRPLKRSLVDVFVSSETLTYALDIANELFQAFEDRGHRVTLASSREFHRPPLNVHDAQKLDHYSGDSWCPGRETVVFIGSVAFGLTIFETTEEADVKYDSNSPIRYVRVGALPTKRGRSRK